MFVKCFAALKSEKFEGKLAMNSMEISSQIAIGIGKGRNSPKG